jgi:hypothetical protein
LSQKFEPEKTLCINATFLCQKRPPMDQSQSSDSALAVISYSRHRGSERGRSFHIHLVNAPNQRTYLANQPSLKYLIFRPSLSPKNIFSLIQSSTPHLLLSTSPPLLLSSSHCHRLLASPSRSNSIISSRESQRSPWSRLLSRTKLHWYCPPSQFQRLLI